MDVFHVFKMVKIVPNRAKYHIRCKSNFIGTAWDELNIMSAEFQICTLRFSDFFRGLRKGALETNGLGFVLYNISLESPFPKRKFQI